MTCAKPMLGVRCDEESIVAASRALSEITFGHNFSKFHRVGRRGLGWEGGEKCQVVSTRRKHAVENPATDLFTCYEKDKAESVMPSLHGSCLRRKRHVL